MKKTLLVLSVIIAIAAIFVSGVFFAQANAQNGGWMMGGRDAPDSPDMMGDAQYGNVQDGGMMENAPYGADRMGGGMSMMGGWNGTDSFDIMGMMAGFSGLSNAQPLTIAETETAVADYLATLSNNDLALGKIMIFDNHAYAQIIDTSAETGAFELLVDPITGSVFPEPGPNMMWNSEYGMMGMMGGGMMGGQYGSDMMGDQSNSDMMDSQYGSEMMGDQSNSGMMGGQYGSGMMGNYDNTTDAEISVTGKQAVEIAQEYLDTYLPGKTADEYAAAFPGYYTLHILEDGETVGMLSVNAITGQVFLHHWHGDFIEMAE